MGWFVVTIILLSQIGGLSIAAGQVQPGSSAAGSPASLRSPGPALAEKPDGKSSAAISAAFTSNESATLDSLPEDHPNRTPYRTRKSAGAHLLSLPATVWHLASRPLGAGIIWIEGNRIPDKAINFFLNDARTGGFFPLISIGGSTGFGAGLRIFHHNLFNREKKIELSGLYSNPDNNSATVKYADPRLFGSNFFFTLDGSYFNDSDENLFIDPDIDPERVLDASIGGNRTDDEDRASFATEQWDAVAEFGYALTGFLGLGGTAGLQRADVGPGDGDDATIELPEDGLGVGVTSLFSVGGTLTFNFSSGWPRTLSGTLLRLSYTYNREIDDDRFEYNRYVAEIQQFLPIPFLAPNRRLGVRGIFEKMDRLRGRQIPFYDLSVLGTSSTLRGYDQNRFRGRGSLLFNIEYRYPIWDSWDAVVFLDEGQVFDDISELRIDTFQPAVGAGIRLMTATGFVMRLELGVSDEKGRLLFEISPNF